MFNLLAGMSAGTICDIVIAVIALIIILVNIKKGFIKQVIGLVATIGSILIAYFFCRTLLTFVNAQFGWQDKLAGSIASSFSSKELFNAALSEENIRAAVQSVSLPEFIADAAVTLLASADGAFENVGVFISDILAEYLLLSLSFIVLFIVARIVLGLIKRLIVKLFTLPVLNKIDMLLALILGLLKSVIIIYVAVYIVQLLPPSISFAGTVRDAVNSSWILSFLKANDVVGSVVSFIGGKFSSL